MNDPDRSRLEHIVDHIARIGRYTADGKAAFDADKMAQDAVLHCLVVIGEAAGALTDATYQQIASLPPHLPVSQRNVIVHECWRLDLNLVWATIQEDLPSLRSEIVQLLEERPATDP